MPGPGFLDFADRWVVVTGASSGLGKACALELAAHGARIVLVGRDAPRLLETAAALATAHETLNLDLDDLERIVPEIQRVSRKVGRLYGLCHAAGLVMTTPLSAHSIEATQSMMRVNVLAGIELAKAITRRDVMADEGGSLLFLSSVYAKAGAAGVAGYCAAKGAISSVVRALAVELARRHVRVNSISPGLVKTPMTNAALGMLSPEHVATIEKHHLLGAGTPGDVARAAVFLLAPATAWITGADLAVDGGYSAH